MEVHHHPQVEKKRFKDYFFEFIMIFLAVTLGFIAENYRDHLSERAKERDYVRGFLKDLDQDCRELRSDTCKNNQKEHGLDTLLTLFLRYLYDSNSTDRTFDSIYQYCNLYIPHMYIFRSYDATMMQVKNSSGFRLIRAPHIADSLAAYDATNAFTEIQGNLYYEQCQKAYEAMASSLDLNYSAGSRRTFGHLPSGIVIVDKDHMKYFCNKIGQCRATISPYVKRLEFAQAQALRLISYLKEEYIHEAGQ